MASRDRMRRSLGWIAVCGYALVTSGLPLPIGLVAPGAADPVAARRLAGKDRSRPFPCMDKPCGCATAEQCFADCCCHTPAERLAWARVHAVEAAVVEALQRRVAASSPSSAGGSCCATARPACCEAAAAPTPACCAAQAEPTPEPVPAEKPEPDRPRTVSLRAMLACGGIVAQWCGTAAAPPPTRVEPTGVEPPRESIFLHDDVAAPLAHPPAAPPPRAA